MKGNRTETLEILVVRVAKLPLTQWSGSGNKTPYKSIEINRKTTKIITLPLIYEFFLENCPCSDESAFSTRN